MVCVHQAQQFTLPRVEPDEISRLYADYGGKTREQEAADSTQILGYCLLLVVVFWTIILSGLIVKFVIL